MFPPDTEFTDYSSQVYSRKCHYITKPPCKGKGNYGGICQNHYMMLGRLQTFSYGVERDSAKLRMTIREARKLEREDRWRKPFESYFDRAREVLGFF